MTPEEVVQKKLEFYNLRDINRFISLFSNDIKFFNFYDNTQTVNGIDECKRV